MTTAELWFALSTNGVVLDAGQREMMKRYIDELIYWNGKVNLVSRKDEENIYEKHILHSLAISKYVEIAPKSYCMDIGTGGGLPGIPVAIANPEIRMTLVDSISKKAKLTDMFAKHTGLRDIGAICSRAEELAQKKEFAGKFDYIMARGVARIERLVEWTAPLLKKSGKWLLLKGGDLSEEIAEAKKRFPALEVQETGIDMFGFPAFKSEEKKLLICKL